MNSLIINWCECGGGELNIVSRFTERAFTQNSHDLPLYFPDLNPISVFGNLLKILSEGIFCLAKKIFTKLLTRPSCPQGNAKDRCIKAFL